MTFLDKTGEFQPTDSGRIPRRVFYGWWIVLAAFLNLFFSVGIVSYGFPVFYPSMVDSHHQDHVAAGTAKVKLNLPHRSAVLTDLTGKELLALPASSPYTLPRPPAADSYSFRPGVSLA